MLINGDSQTQISATDRGLQYGDGLFETIAVVDSRPCLWERHYTRLKAGCTRLGIDTPDAEILYHEVIREIGSNADGVIKVIVSRGAGGRGYKPNPDSNSNRIISFSASPNYPEAASNSGVKVRVCNARLGRNRLLAGMKHLNRLEQVMARAEWDDENILEGLMLDVEDNVVEGTMSNLFVLKDKHLKTPDLSWCGVAGVMRDLVIDVAAEQNIKVKTTDLGLKDLMDSDAMFLTNSLIGIWPVRELDGKLFNLPESLGSLFKEVRKQAYV